MNTYSDATRTPQPPTPMEWPEADRCAWKRVLTPGDLFDRRSRASRWSKATRRRAEFVYGTWLAWLLQEGHLKWDATPSVRITRRRLNRYIAWLRISAAPWTVYSYINVLHAVLRLMAPGKDWRWIGTICNGLRRTVIATRYVPERVRPSRDLVKYGVRLMAEAEASTLKTSYDRAVQFRDGLMIATLAARPLRLTNFVSIRIGENLIRLGKGYQLIFRASETKTSRPLQFELPAALVPLLNRYLAYHRTVLVNAENWQKVVKQGGKLPKNALWVSNSGTAMSRRSVGRRVAKLTEREFGVVISPHLFRHCAATSIAIEDPENIRTASIILGHSTCVTVERSYNHAPAVAAASRYHEIILKLRSKVGPARRPSGTPTAKRSST